MQAAVFFPVRLSFKPISLWVQVALYKTYPNILCCNLPQLIENLCNITDTLLSSYLFCPPFLLRSTMKWNWPQMAGNEVLQRVTILLHVYRALRVFIHCINGSVKDFSTQQTTSFTLVFGLSVVKKTSHATVLKHRSTKQARELRAFPGVIEFWQSLFTPSFQSSLRSSD